MASDKLLDIQGIKGESFDSKRPGTIEVEHFSWGASNDGSAAHGSGAGAGKVRFGDFQATARVSKASPELMQACANGKHFNKAQLFVRRQGGKQEEVYVLTLEDFIVSSFHSGGSDSSGHLPTDQFALNFARIKFEYKMQKDDGSLAPAVTGGWDLKANKAL